MSRDVLIGSVDTRDDEQIRVELDDWGDGSVFVSAQHYWRNKDGTFTPNQDSVIGSITPDQADFIATLLQQAAAEARARAKRLKGIEVTTHVDYLTLIETYTVDGRPFDISYNSTLGMFEARVDGARWSHGAIQYLHDAILEHCGRSEEKKREDEERSEVMRKASQDFIREHQEMLDEVARLQARVAELEAPR